MKDKPRNLGKWIKASKEYCKLESEGFAKRRKRGKIVGGSRLDNCYSVQWNGMSRPETIHRSKFDFIDPLDEIFVSKEVVI